jgi:acetyltransferase EpsM
MTDRLSIYVFGSGGHGKVVADAAIASGLFAVRGFLDDDRGRWGQVHMGLPIEGGLEALGGRQGRVGLALGVGLNEPRLGLLERLLAEGHTVVTVVHPSAVMASGASLGVGSYVGPLALVHTDARVGRACIVNSGAVVEHDDMLGDGVHVAPGARLGGNVTLGDLVHIGLGASVIHGVTIGARSVVGAGAVVIAEVPQDATVVGIPARPLPFKPLDTVV